ncbi:MAG: nuclear transport factor 2 family protein [Deltaproteobacteria bacterium]|nr:nuclear transport factor 2 family protein [Deltaproteobacteria bacterium]
MRGFVLLAFVAGCATTGAMTAVDRQAAVDDVNQLLDDWHRAASAADLDGYIGPLSDDAVFMGTDATERWSAEEFAEFVAPYFEKGQGWTYAPRDRHVMLSQNGRTAWFDERLDSEKYGELRGTGVLRLGDQGWELAHYSMSFPVPNDVTKSVVALIRGEEQAR